MEKERREYYEVLRKDSSQFIKAFTAVEAKEDMKLDTLWQATIEIVPHLEGYRWGYNIKDHPSLSVLDLDEYHIRYGSYSILSILKIIELLMCNSRINTADIRLELKNLVTKDIMPTLSVKLVQSIPEIRAHERASIFQNIKSLIEEQLFKIRYLLNESTLTASLCRDIIKLELRENGDYKAKKWWQFWRKD